MTISDFSRDAVRQYLRSVVLIDDAIFDTLKITYDDETLRLDGVPTLALNGGNASSDVAPDLEVSGGNAHGGGTLRLNNDMLLDARAITDGFARIGVICGVYQPTSYPADDFQNENFQTLLNVCKHADVFILDWNLFKDNTSAVSQLLCYLEKEDAEGRAPQPVRFCVIYTKANVPMIYTEVYKALNRKEPEDHPTNELYTIRKNNLTVVIYGQEVASCHIDESQVVSPGGLANRIVQDYAKTYEGILPALALRGIASIRENTKRILDKFPREMDSALVLHAGLTMHDVDISKDITSLLSDETAAILADKQIPSDDIYELCREYVKWECPGDFLSSIKDTPNLVPQDVSSDDIRNFFIQVFNDKKLPKKTKVFEPCKKKLQLHRIDVNLLAALASLVRKKITPGAVYRFGALAALFCQRTNYGDIRLLRFGTIVSIRRDREGKPSVEYYLCLMPTCDSKRLPDTDKKTGEKVKHGFPFWRLEKVSSNHQGRSHGVVILDGEEYSPYCIKGKIRQNFALYEFYSEGGVVKFDESSCVKTCDGNAQFTWVAELKPTHSQRMAEYVSREFSRVGLIESEWLRLQVDR